MSDRRLPAGVWALGLTSLFMDVSSEMVHGLLPLFLVGTLGASPLLLGFIEGAAEAIAQIVKLFSGALSDRLGRRKGLTVAGYALAALTKPVFPLAGSALSVAAARFIDRIGKGIRGAPRDALVADLTPLELRGAAFGLRQSMDTVGAFLGPLIAIGLMLLWGDVRAVLWVAVIPAVLAVATLVVFVREPERHEARGKAPPRLSDARQFARPYWILLGGAALFGLARFGEAFLILRAHDLGLAEAYAPLVLVVMNIVYAAVSYPAGILSDRLGRHGLLAVGLGVLVVADLALALAPSLTWAFAGIVLWGLHMGLTQGVLAAVVADAAPARLRGSAFGLFFLVSGIAQLGGGLLAGLLWQEAGPMAAYLAAAAVAVPAGFMLLAAKGAMPPSP